MTIEKREVTKYEDVFIAYDGNSFGAEKACKDYEERVYPNGIRERKDIEWLDTLRGYSAIISKDSYYCYDDSYMWLIPKTEEAINALNKAYNCDDFEESHIGKVVAVDYTYDCDVYVDTADRVATHCKDYLDRMGYDVTMTNRRTNESVTSEKKSYTYYELRESVKFKARQAYWKIIREVRGYENDVDKYNLDNEIASFENVAEVLFAEDGTIISATINTTIQYNA